MNRLPLILSSIAVAILAGCATESRVTSAPAPVAAAPAMAAPVVAVRRPRPGPQPQRLSVLRQPRRCAPVWAASNRFWLFRPLLAAARIDVDQAHRHEDGRRLDAVLRHGSRGPGDGRPHRDHEGRHHEAPGLDARISPSRLASLLTRKGPLARPSSFTWRFVRIGRSPDVWVFGHVGGNDVDHSQEVPEGRRVAP